MNFLSRAEEIILLCIIKLEGEAYGISIRQFIHQATGAEWSLAQIYDPLDRLTHKGFVRKTQGPPSPERGGRPKWFYTVTPEGKDALAELRRIHLRLSQADAEQLGLHGIQVEAGVDLIGEDRRPAIQQQQARGWRSAGYLCSRRGSRCWSRRACRAARPKYSPILRQAMQCSTQNRRTAGSWLERVKPPSAMGCEKQVGLKSRPCPLALAQSIQAAKCSGRSSLRSTFWPPVSA